MCVCPYVRACVCVCICVRVRGGCAQTDLDLGGAVSALEGLEDDDEVDEQTGEELAGKARLGEALTAAGTVKMLLGEQVHFTEMCRVGSCLVLRALTASEGGIKMFLGDQVYLRVASFVDGYFQAVECGGVAEMCLACFCFFWFAA